MGPTMPGRRRRPATVDYRTLPELRYHVRRFLRAREIAARAEGVEPQHYLLLLQVKGLEGEQPVTIGTLAERLPLRNHSTIERLALYSLSELRAECPALVSSLRRLIGDAAGPPPAAERHEHSRAPPPPGW